MDYISHHYLNHQNYLLDNQSNYLLYHICHLIHFHLEKQGACFGETSGWERPNWFLNENELSQKKIPEYKYSWKRQNWFSNSAHEHKAVRNSVGLFDLSSFGKIILSGKDSEDFLQKICGNNF